MRGYFKMKKIIKLINDERINVKIQSSKSCDTISYDLCAVYDGTSCASYSYDKCNKDYAACTGGATDTCEKDYASCYDGAYDICTEIDTDACRGNTNDYN